MKYTSPPGSADPNAPYVTGNPVTKVKGSPVPAEAVEYPQREIVNAIIAAGITPDNGDLTQLTAAILTLAGGLLPGLATLLQPGLVMPDGTTLSVDNNGRLSVIVQQQMDPVGGIRFFEDEMPRPGYVECNAGVVTDFSTRYPQMAAYLETPWGQARLVSSLAEYETLHTAIWHTNADGTTVGWQGIGGVAKFWWDKTADTLKMPDLQDMFQGAAGPSLGVGGVRGDMVRRTQGSLRVLHETAITNDAFAGIITATTAEINNYTLSAVSGSTYGYNVDVDNARVVPTGAANTPRSWGALACAYLGQPAS